MGVAIVLDPRFKLMFLKMCFPIIYGEDKGKEEIKKIQCLCYNLVEEYSSKAKMRKSSGLVDDSSTQLVDNEDDAEFLISFLKFVASRECKVENVRSELDDHLQEKMVPMVKDFDILSWWRNTSRYPTLQLIARDIFAIPISTMASESTFSSTERVISSRHSSLHPKTIEPLMCMQNWLKDSCPLSTIQSICSTFDEEEDEQDEEELSCYEASINGLDSPAR